ncbi:predicted protein [Nematostella vectensis]|uniref:Fe2OG dioxygenase domain-containing protein n=1 Tax=Nematostella vectensis TaxID=45351 RepID=A7SVG0_NEMVE|nr:predicted protein [Nematostella vectensis]|eukprot:XP_001624402.1 predicted protein [Nematostella vectensis]
MTHYISRYFPFVDMSAATKLPVVDFDAFSIASSTRPDANSDEAQQLANNVLQGFDTAGFIYLKNHGIPQNKFDSVVHAWNTFVALPTDVKSAHQLQPGGFNGWGSIEGERHSVHRRVGDLKEVFHVSAIHDPAFEWIWPAKSVPEFKPAVRSLYQDFHLLLKRVLSAVAIGLGLPPDIFDIPHLNIGTSKNMSEIKCNFYPKPVEAKPGQIGCGEHFDAGSLTILYQDSDGLQVEKEDGTFIPVPFIDGTLVVNIGHLMQRWTSDRLKANVSLSQTGRIYRSFLCYSKDKDLLKANRKLIPNPH